jgi:hypothetical protein
MTELDTGTLPAVVPAKVQMGWGRIIADPKVIMGTIAFVMLLISGAVAGKGGTPAEKLDFYKHAVWAGAGIYIAVLGALGYETGKLLEGVVPAGFLPAAQASTASVASFAQPLLSASVSTHTYDAVRQALHDHEQDNKRPAASTTDARLPQPGKLTALLLLLLPAFFFAGGCTSTSQAFKRTIGGGINNVVQDMHDYQANRNWDVNGDGVIDSAEAAARSQEIGQVNTLAASVADVNAITLEGVSSAWQPVKPVYLGYLTADTSLDERSRQNFQATAADIDKTIADEKARQGNLLNFFQSKSQ